MSPQPGRSFYHMWTLVGHYLGIIAPTPATRELIIAIMWEESLFNNGTQYGGGTAEGFGQTEPSEWVYINGDATTRYRSKAVVRLSERARLLGYAVRGLPGTYSYTQKVRIQGKEVEVRRTRARSRIQDDCVGCKLACAFVRHLWESGQRSLSSILNAYGGKGFKGPQPKKFATKGGRGDVISGWLRCRDLLAKASLFEMDSIYENKDVILDALNESRPFKNVRAAFEPLLFPGKEKDRPAVVNPWV